MHFQVSGRILSILLFVFMLYACGASENNSSLEEPVDTITVAEPADAPDIVDINVPGEDTAISGDLVDTVPTPATDTALSTEPAAGTETTIVSDAGITAVPLADNTIRIDARGTAQPFDQQLLGSNIPAWLSNRLRDEMFQARTFGSGTSVMRIPGGSWSNSYDWLGCEMRDESMCYWTWAARPTDFIDFLRTTGNEAMYTVNMNGTAQEAAALVAFFNGSVDDTRSIGMDRRGRDWKTVGHWAQLRSDHGNPEPFTIRLWEVGNEIYGGKSGQGSDCLDWGWEDVWTCDGTEYVNGLDSGSSGHDGFRAFRDAMRAVDDSILVGAIGVEDQAGWENWGNEVIAAAGNEMDFYSIHHYAYFNPPASYAEVLTKPQNTWGAMMQNVRTAFEQYAGGREVPIAMTEYNLFAWIDSDQDQMMTRAVNALFLADTIGQMGQHGFSLANQWNLANGANDSGADYGLFHADTYEPYPAYYVFPLWAQFGTTMLPVTSSYPADTTLSVYAGRVDATTLSLLAVNKTGTAIEATIHVDGVTSISGGSVDVLQATSLDSQTMLFNGSSDPSDDLSDAPSRPLTELTNPLPYTFEPYSVTLIRLTEPITR